MRGVSFFWKLREKRARGRNQKPRASKIERIAKIKKRIKDEIKTARVAGVSIESLKKAQARERGATLDDIKSRINANNLQETKDYTMSKDHSSSSSSRNASISFSSRVSRFVNMDTDGGGAEAAIVLDVLVL